MNKQSWLLILLITNCVLTHSQIYENFEGIEGSLSQMWKGDVSHYNLEGGYLHLRSEHQGPSRIWLTYDLLETFEWEFLIHLDFEPSYRNRLRIYLWTASVHFDNSDAIYLELGEDGKGDTVTLFERISGKVNRLGSGPVAAAYKTPTVRCRFLFSSPGLFTLKADYEGGSVFYEEFTVDANFDINMGNGYFGIECHYTPSRSDRFYFDDIYIGPERNDTLPPYVLESNIYESSISLRLNELISHKALKETFFELIPSKGIGSIQLDERRAEVQIIIDEILPEQVPVILKISGLSDESGNRMDTLIYLIRSSDPEPGNILINEVLFNPNDSGYDFIEIINMTDRYLNLSGVVINNVVNNSRGIIRGPCRINPLQIMAITPSAEDLRRRYNVQNDLYIRQNELPRLSNDYGRIVLHFNNLRLDEMEYDEAMHHPSLEDFDGVSLERISTANPGNDPANWISASEIAGFATPSAVNSTSHTTISGRGNGFTLLQNIFSPDGDGQQDILVINYSLPSNDFVINATIFNESGIIIRQLLSPLTLGVEGQLIWDGRNDRGIPGHTGIYIIVIQGFSPSNGLLKEKLTCGLIQRG